MSYSARMQKNHLYSVYFAPRGNVRMVDLGMQIAQQYLSPFDRLIGLIGKPGSGKSMLVKGMFPGLELTNDDEGLNIRPLPLLEASDEGFYTAHTYHVDVRFELGFTQYHELADAINNAIAGGKRVIVEHFELIYPYLNQNAHLLIGAGEEIVVTRPTLFGPDPDEVAEIVFKSIDFRLKTHSAEDVCEFCLRKQGIEQYEYEHSDVRHGFILSFEHEPVIDFEQLRRDIEALIAADLPISFADDTHVLIGEERHRCTGPRMHVKTTGAIGKLTLLDQLFCEPITNRFLLVGTLDDGGRERIDRLNRIEA